jgi:Domain of unknown function (DUF4129)
VTSDRHTHERPGTLRGPRERAHRWCTPAVLCVLLAVAIPATISAQADNPAGAIADSAHPRVVMDSSTVIVRRPDAQKLADIREDNDYTYDREQEASDTLLERILRWCFEQLRTVLGDEGASSFMEYAGYGLAAGALIMVVLKLMGSNVRGLFRRAKVAGTSELEVAEENIHVMDFDSLIAEAVAARNFRKAVRLQYLKQIKALADRGLIRWRIDRTNREYEREIGPAALRGAFSEITLMFEYAWYGDLPVTEPIYRSASEEFAAFGRKLAEAA